MALNETENYCHYCGDLTNWDQADHFHDLSGDPICDDCARDHGYACISCGAAADDRALWTDARCNGCNPRLYAPAPH